MEILQRDTPFLFRSGMVETPRLQGEDRSVNDMEVRNEDEIIPEYDAAVLLTPRERVSPATSEEWRIRERYSPKLPRSLVLFRKCLGSGSRYMD